MQLATATAAPLGLGRVKRFGEVSFFMLPSSSSVLSPMAPVFRRPRRYAASEAARSRNLGRASDLLRLSRVDLGPDHLDERRDAAVVKGG